MSRADIIRALGLSNDDWNAWWRAQAALGNAYSAAAAALEVHDSRRQRSERARCRVIAKRAARHLVETRPLEARALHVCAEAFRERDERGDFGTDPLLGTADDEAYRAQLRAEAQS